MIECEHIIRIPVFFDLSQSGQLTSPVDLLSRLITMPVVHIDGQTAIT